MGNKKITADEFVDAFTKEWEVFSVERNVSGITPFEARGNWTLQMTTENGFLHRVMRRLNAAGRELEYRMEWYKVDALYVGGEDIYGRNLTYPSEVHAIIEHEFDENLETEMWKLIHWRCPLKVIINYDWAESEKTSTSRKAYRGEKLRKLWTMLAAVNAFYPEAGNAEYLVLMATRDTTDSKISWMPYKYRDLPESQVPCAPAT